MDYAKVGAALIKVQQCFNLSGRFYMQHRARHPVGGEIAALAVGFDAIQVACGLAVAEAFYFLCFHVD